MSETPPAMPKPLFDVDLHSALTEEYVAARRQGLMKIGGVLVVAAWLVGVATAVLLAVLYDALQDADELGVLGTTATQSGWVRFFSLAIGGIVATLLLGAAGALLHYVGARDGLAARGRSTGSAASVDAEPNAQ